jgi:hypothetical protein
MSAADAAGFSRRSSSGTLDCAASSSTSRTSSDEYAALLARSGLRLTNTIALGAAPEAMGHQLVEAQPV